jgi:hypothetical protein
MLAARALHMHAILRRPASQCVSKKVAVSDAITMSPSATKWRPPPEHMPFTAVITGFRQRFCSAVIWLYGAALRPPCENLWLSPDAVLVMSQPVQKAFSPARVTIAHR